MSKLKRLKFNQNGLYPTRVNDKARSVTYLKDIDNLSTNGTIIEINLGTNANCLAQVFVVAGKPVIVTFNSIVCKYF
jgi:hypothetical protein